MEFCTLFSGSSGNSIYVGTDKTKLLVDAGLSGKKIQEGLKEIGINPTDINGILITHEHDDHIKGAGILSRRFDIPIYANEDTWSAIHEKVGEIKSQNIKVFDNYATFEIGDVTVIPFKTPHDAISPCGYSFVFKNKKISIATDIGHTSLEVKDNIKDSDLILLESNHDVEMLKVGPYPYHLKRRVLSEIGHLSNEDCGRTIVDILNSKIKNCFRALKPNKQLS